MTPPTQTLASGKTIADQYGSFGVAKFNEVTSPAYHFGMYVGEAGVGKTSLYREHAGALIFNFDLHSTPKPSPDAPPPACQVFPVVNERGIPLGPNMKPISVTWSIFEDAMDRLLAAASKGNPRPQTIVFDTMQPTVLMKKTHYAIQKLGKPDAVFEDFPGGKPTLTAYGRVYDSYIPMIMDLKSAGFGVHLIAHIMTKDITNDEGQVVRTEVSHNIPDKVFGRFFALLEFLACIEVHMVLPVIGNQKGGQPIFARERVAKHYLINLSEKLHELTRSRVALPAKLELPAIGAWQIFEQAYLHAAGKKSS